MNLTLYQISDEFRALLDNGFDPETGEALPVLEEKRGQLAEKVNAVAAYILNTEADAEQCDAVIKRVTAMKKSAVNRAEWLRRYLHENMLRTGINEIKGEGFKVTLYRDRDEQVMIDPAATFPPELCNEPKAPEPSKTKIKAAIQAGEPVAGAWIVRKDRLTIK